MKVSSRKRVSVVVRVLLLVGAGVVSGEVRAEDCKMTPEGRVCRVGQEIRAGVQVDVDTQRRLGLVTINGGCSGTLLNRFWVLTARHCVVVNPQIVSSALLQPSQVTVSATWAPDRVGIASRIRDFGVNTAPGSPRDRDIVLVYLGAADLGPVDSQRIYAIARDHGGGSVRLSGRLTTADTVTQYGRGFSTFATGVFGTPTAVAATGLDVFRSAQFTPSSISATHYDLAMNPSNQVGHGGDSGGPSVVTVGGFGAGIAGVQSTCTPTGYVTNAPVPRQWQWATGISLCTYVATEPFLGEIIDAVRERPLFNATLFQRHVDGRIWKYDRASSCAGDACPGWTEIDHNTQTRDIVAARGTLFQRHANGKLWKYDGNGQCTGAACPGWIEIDHNTRTAAIAGGVHGLYQRHVDGKVWKYDGNGQCTTTACPGWTLIDQNPRTKHIVAARGTLFQRHADGRIWKYDGKGKCGARFCPGWIEIDHNTRTAAIAGGSDGFFQRHADGRIWRYDGNGQCTPAACPGWTEIDHNPQTRDIVASGSALFQRQADGRLWRYDGKGQCTASACPGWTEIDHNPQTRDIVASGTYAFQRHADGRIWKHDGTAQCTPDACPGWTEIDRNARTAAIVAVEPF